MQTFDYNLGHLEQEMAVLPSIIASSSSTDIKIFDKMLSLMEETRGISRAIYYALMDKLIYLSDINSKSSDNAKGWALISITFFLSITFIGLFLMIIGKLLLI
jgi:hypothetical protein